MEKREVEVEMSECRDLENWKHQGKKKGEGKLQRPLWNTIPLVGRDGMNLEVTAELCWGVKEKKSCTSNLLKMLKMSFGEEKRSIFLGTTKILKIRFCFYSLPCVHQKFLAGFSQTKTAGVKSPQLVFQKNTHSFPSSQDEKKKPPQTRNKSWSWE